MSPHFQVLKGPKAISRVFPQWEELLDASSAEAEAPDFFLRTDWLEPWLEQFSDRGEVFLAVLQDGDRWRAGLPMQIVKGHYGNAVVRHLSVAGFPESDCTFIPALCQADRQEFVRQLVDWWQNELPQAVTLDFRELPQAGPSIAALKASGAPCSRFLHVYPVSRSPRYQLDAFEQAGQQIGGKLGQNLRRRKRILYRAGQVEFHFERIRPDQVESCLQTCAEIEAKSWKGQKHVGMLAKQSRSFVHRVWQHVAPKGGLAVATLVLDGQTIAYHWGMLRGGCFLSYNLAHLPEHHQYSPGTLLLQHMVEKAAELGIREMDASRGGLDHLHILAPYKGPVRIHSRLIWFRPSLVGRFLSWRMKHRLTDQASKEGELAR
jgi:CelD/BcsL family acetyltransferase involved in cellulose biosynthesis